MKPKSGAVFAKDCPDDAALRLCQSIGDGVSAKLKDTVLRPVRQ